ncbi:elongin A, like [Megalops cyprinoides]|uniref:elongin A, like n=1 Tax=Megalops cyprinoides TaxID=118141 RepID=UPI0018648386|nr:elongin A, like [Megalops cyprinoides]
MAAADVSKKVLQLKQQLKESSESKTILKILKRLQGIDITLDILAETGIGKAVNAFRKHGNAGEVAKSLVSQWKKLIPKESTSEGKKTKVLKITKKPCGSNDENQQSEDELEKPAMSFESYLSYDLKAPKRKNKSYDDKRTAKKLRVNGERTEPPGKATNGKTSTEEPLKKVSTGSVMDLLNVPLPTFLPECEDLNNFPYIKKKPEDVVPVVCEEAPIFTGQRLNRKMQVYSGPKTTFLPTMMSLHQQCLRAIRNNIDLLYEIGGVPFEILEPVLERCTPEQLLRIEECNSVYIEETDHLWKTHCQRDFKNGRLEEYESFREMYLRLSEERESKLKRLTESIVSAHSGKPKGRQVKLTFINTAVKPPRHVRIQQEIHGTAGSVLQSNLLNPPSVKPLATGARPSCSGTTSSTSQAQDPKKMRRVAPMMAKSLKAFKKQLGRR